MNKKIIYIAGCAIGGVLVGLFANKLNTSLGIALFAVGAFLLAVFAYAATKEDKK